MGKLTTLSRLLLVCSFAFLISTLDANKASAAPTVAKDSLTQTASTSYRPAEVEAKGTGALKTDCPKGQFYDIAHARCYSCPKGYGRTGNAVTSDKACSRKTSKILNNAKYQFQNSNAVSWPAKFTD